MDTRSTAQRRRAPHVTAAPAPHSVTQALLLEYLANAAVSELVIAEVTIGTYALDACLTWRVGRSRLIAARGEPRLFRSLDTVATFLRTTGTGATIVRLELLR